MPDYVKLAIFGHNLQVVMDKLLKRKIDSFLLKWKDNPQKKPLIIKGARQIGKTRSIEWFAYNNYSNVIQINFVEQPKYKGIFENIITK